MISTFCGQAYGAKNYKLVGIWLQISIIVGIIFSIPVIIAWNFTGNILQLFKEHEPNGGDKQNNNHKIVNFWCFSF